MANLIKYLPEYIIHRIAAGEIIKNPSSVIKELLENSLDAHAKIIDIFLINAGKTLIKVSDNGQGMNQYDASICFKQYTTSKIEKFEDLFKLHTKGFRGEALSAIASISQFEIITKDHISDIGLHLIIEKNIIKKQIPIQINRGTNIIVKNIFFNIPVRRNLLKSNPIELDAIIYEFSKIALAHFDVTFRLYNNNNLIFNLQASSLKERIIHIFNEHIHQEFSYILDEENNIKIKGFLSKPFYSKKDKSEQFLFINDRFFYDKSLHKTILKYYKNYLKIGHYPSYFIFLYLDPKDFDINIDPTKNLINFYNASNIYNIIKKNIQIVLGKYKVKNIEYFNQSTSYLQDNNLINDTKQLNKSEFLNEFKYYINTNQCSNYNTIFQSDCNNILFKIQIYKKYIITYYNSQLIIIDQHRAHQRILYDKFLISSKQKINYKHLLVPIRIPLSIKECQYLQILQQDFKNIGLLINYYNNFIIIKSIPDYLNNKNIVNFIQEILAKNMLKQEIKNYFNILISYMAKSHAIKSGIYLTNEEMNILINELFLCKNFTYSPFNKRIYIILNINFLHNQFRKKNF